MACGSIKDRNGYSAGVHAPLPFGRGHPLDAVSSRLMAQAVGAGALNGQG